MRERGGRLSKTLQRRKREDWGEGLLALEATEILTQESDTGVTILVDARNGFNKMSRL